MGLLRPLAKPPAASVDAAVRPVVSIFRRIMEARDRQPSVLPHRSREKIKPIDELNDFVKPWADGQLYAILTNYGYQAATGMNAEQLKSVRAVHTWDHAKSLLSDGEKELVAKARAEMLRRLKEIEGLDRRLILAVCQDVAAGGGRFG